jgi:hypothetical protein
MRPAREKKSSPVQQREELLRQGRAAAPPLRDAWPTAAFVKVTLRFVTSTLPGPAEQSVALYPAARAYFVYPCPHGDCNGVFDLGAAAERALKREKSHVEDTLECAGLRSRDGLTRQPCGVRVSYRITAQHEPAAVAAKRQKP